MAGNRSRQRLVAAGSILVYKEKLNRAQWAAFILTIAGLTIIRI
ncbi:hypothetical protein [Paenibacillus sp. MMO-58]